MEWAQILVIILSIFLAIFLLLAIILTILLIRVTNQIKSVTSGAERVVQNIETAASNISRITSPVLVAKIVTSYVKKFMKAKK
ncbi:MAG: hypothetical protein WAQ22_01995 [Candidatus Saccharimonas sp.]